MITTCNLCGSESIKDWFLMDAGKYYAPEKSSRRQYTIAFCADCSLVFVKEIPTDEELKDIYSEGYYKGRDEIGYENYESGAGKTPYALRLLQRVSGIMRRPHKLASLEYAIRRRTFKSGNRAKDMRLINDCTGRRGRLLDVGCAMGTFLSAAMDDGWNAEGVELSEFGAQHTRNSLNVNVFNGSLNEAISTGGIDKDAFDVVTLWDALEHLTDPAGVFRDVNRALKEGGWFFFSTVNIDSLLARREGKEWHFFRPPKHLYYYSEKTLKRYLTKYGFSIAMDDDYRKDLIVVGARKEHAV